MIFLILTKFHLRINLLWPSIFVTELRLEIRLVFMLWSAGEIEVDHVYQEDLPIVK